MRLPHQDRELTDEQVVFVECVHDVLQSAPGLRYHAMMADDPGVSLDGVYAIFVVDTNARHDIDVVVALSEKAFIVRLNEHSFALPLDDEADEEAHEDHEDDDDPHDDAEDRDQDREQPVSDAEDANERPEVGALPDDASDYEKWIDRCCRALTAMVHGQLRLTQDMFFSIPVSSRLHAGGPGEWRLVGRDDVGWFWMLALVAPFWSTPFLTRRRRKVYDDWYLAAAAGPPGEKSE